jgi:hypothetical protein
MIRGEARVAPEEPGSLRSASPPRLGGVVKGDGNGREVHLNDIEEEWVALLCKGPREVRCPMVMEPRAGGLAALRHGRRGTLERVSRCSAGV